MVARRRHLDHLPTAGEGEGNPRPRRRV